MKRLRLGISGKVQGVAYRFSAVQAAGSIGVKGWVKNIPGGSVEAVVEGESGDVDKFVKWCKIGPSMARVDDLSVANEEVTGEFVDFQIKY